MRCRKLSGLFQGPAGHALERHEVEGFFDGAVLRWESCVASLEKVIETRVDIDLYVGIAGRLQCVPYGRQV